MSLMLEEGGGICHGDLGIQLTLSPPQIKARISDRENDEE